MVKTQGGLKESIYIKAVAVQGKDIAMLMRNKTPWGKIFSMHVWGAPASTGLSESGNPYV